MKKNINSLTADTNVRQAWLAVPDLISHDVCFSWVETSLREAARAVIEAVQAPQGQSAPI